MSSLHLEPFAIPIIGQCRAGLKVSIRERISASVWHKVIGFHFGEAHSLNGVNVIFLRHVIGTLNF